MTYPLICLLTLSAVPGAPAERRSYVDGRGVMRWRDDDSEIALFGVNYYTPFTIDYEGIEKLGEDHRRAIDRDAAHFERLGLDAIRLHVFDRQISDRDGNLLANEHLDLFDYLVSVCKRRGIYTVLTPIAWWPYHTNGRGFSSLYTKPQMVLDPKARKAQAEYLRQFMEHVNPYTQRAYKDEPAVVAIELINEPLYDRETTAEQVRGYIDELAGAVRSTGAGQPIFYNGWANMEEAVARSSIEGCTFGWYPTGLVSGACLRGNYLSAVDDYPRMRLPCLAGKAKIVYEFDAADVPGRVMYPAMARAFRSGGAQIATQFQYDPLPLAPCNYGWQTHYLNLVFAPGKTISFAIAAEVFRRTPRLARFEPYPENAAFGPFRIDFDHDLSMMVTDADLLYSNHTSLQPPAPEKLTRIVGCGSSRLVDYGGTGAYFLDRIDEGVWRLEVYPDAVWVGDPFAATSLSREVSRVIWARHPMTIRLPDLGDGFSSRRIVPQAGPSQTAAGGRIAVEPGGYVLARAGRPIPPEVTSAFYAPKPTRDEVAVWWQCPDSWREGIDMPVQATVGASDASDVCLHLGESRAIRLERIEPYVYAAAVPGSLLRPGKAVARLEVKTPRGMFWFPEGAERTTSLEPFTVWEMRADARLPVLQGKPDCRIERADGPALGVECDGFGEEPSSAGFRLPAFAPGEAGYDTIAILARATCEATDRVELGMVEQDGKAYGADIPVWQEWHDVKVPMDRLKPLWGTAQGRLDPTRLGEVSFVFGAWLYGPRRGESHGFEVRRVALEQSVAGRLIDVAASGDPVPLFIAGTRPIRITGEEDRQATIVRGRRPGRQAVRVWTNAFGAPPSSISFRQAAPDGTDRWRETLKQCNAAVITARASTPETNGLEVVLLEKDSAPWGAVIPLTKGWREIVVPLDDFRFFSHWQHPSGRGGRGDRFHPENVQAVNFCFGAWLFGKRAAQPHGIEVESVTLVTGH